VALPMDEQRILEEMERVLAADDPRLAAQLASFGRPGVGRLLRSRRARSLLTLAMFAVIAVLIYTMSTLRLGATAHSPRSGNVSGSTSAQPRSTSVNSGSKAPGSARCVATDPPVTCGSWLLVRPGTG
jgi:hypothetical protein